MNITDNYGLIYTNSSGGLILGTDDRDVFPNADPDKKCNPILYLPTNIDGISVIRIGKSAFRKHGLLKKVVIPRTVQTIGYDAFAYNTLLTQVYFQEGSELTQLENGTFYHCTSLRFIRLPFSLSSTSPHIFGITNISTLAYCGLTEISEPLLFSRFPEISELSTPINIIVSADYPSDSFGGIQQISKSYRCEVFYPTNCQTVHNHLQLHSSLFFIFLGSSHF